MKDFKVEAIKKFTDKEEKKTRNIGDVFEVTKERYLYLKQNNAVKLVEEITKEETQAIAPAIVEEAEEQEKPIEEVVNEIVEESKEDKSKKKARKK